MCVFVNVCVCVMDGWICLECFNKRPIDRSLYHNCIASHRIDINILYSTIIALHCIDINILLPPGFTALKVFDPKEGMAAVLISSSVDNKIRLWNIDSGREANDGVDR